MRYVVRGTRFDKEHDLSFHNSKDEAETSVRHQEERNRYENLHVVDLDAWRLEEYRKLDPDKIERLAREGDPIARRVLAETPIEHGLLKTSPVSGKKGA